MLNWITLLQIFDWVLFIFSRLTRFQYFHIWHLQPRPSGKSFSAGISLHREKSRNSFRAVFGHLILHFNVFYFRTCWSAVDLLTASQIPQNSFWNQSWNLASRVCTLNNKISVKTKHCSINPHFGACVWATRGKSQTRTPHGKKHRNRKRGIWDDVPFLDVSCQVEARIFWA